MKVFLRKAAGRLYLTNNGHWGPKTEAQEFNGIHEAGREAQRHQDVDVILSYDNPPCELALNPAFCSTPPHPSYRQLHGPSRA